MQFIYGDDGLDPANLEGDGKPVVYERTWNHARALRLSTTAEGLLPYEIKKRVEETLATPYFTNTLSEPFLNEVRDYVQEEIVEKAAAYREMYGMAPALEQIEEDSDANKGADCSSIRFHSVVSLRADKSM